MKLSEIYEDRITRDSTNRDINPNGESPVRFGLGAEYALDTITPQVAIAFAKWRGVYIVVHSTTDTTCSLKDKELFELFLEQYKP